MKEITTKSGKLLLVKVTPNCEYDLDKALYFSLYNLTLGRSEMTLSNPNLNCRDLEILGKFSELKDDDFEEFVLQWGQDMNKDIINSVVLGFSDIIKVDENGLYYKDYLDNINNNYTLTVKESFQSLVKSQGLDDNLDNYLIIKVL